MLSSLTAWIDPSIKRGLPMSCLFHLVAEIDQSETSVLNAIEKFS